MKTDRNSSDQSPAGNDRNRLTAPIGRLSVETSMSFRQGFSLMVEKVWSPQEGPNLEVLPVGKIFDLNGKDDDKINEAYNLKKLFQLSLRSGSALWAALPEAGTPALRNSWTREPRAKQQT